MVLVIRDFFSVYSHYLYMYKLIFRIFLGFWAWETSSAINPLFYFNFYLHSLIAIFLFLGLFPPVMRNKKGLFICPNCGNLYKYRPSVYTHLRNDCGKSPFVCKPCDFSCKYDHAFRRHCLTMSHHKKVAPKNNKRSNLLM